MDPITLANIGLWCLKHWKAVAITALVALIWGYTLYWGHTRYEAGKAAEAKVTAEYKQKLATEKADHAADSKSYEDAIKAVNLRWQNKVEIDDQNRKKVNAQYQSEITKLKKDVSERDKKLDEVVPRGSITLRVSSDFRLLYNQAVASFPGYTGSQTQGADRPGDLGSTEALDFNVVSHKLFECVNSYNTLAIQLNKTIDTIEHENDDITGPSRSP